MSLGMGEGMSDDHGPRVSPRITVQCSCGAKLLDVYAELGAMVSVALLSADCPRCGGECRLSNKYVRANQGMIYTLEAATP